MTLTPSDMLPLRLNPQSPTSCRIHAKGPPDQSRARRALRATVVFCFVFMIIEGTIGFLAHSLAVLTDAAHMLTDVGALALALMSIHAFSWGATERYTYGWQRAEVLGALGSVFTIWALVGGIMIEAVSRIIDDVKCAQDVEKADCDGIDAKLMLMIGCIGFAVNIICALILHWGGHHGHSHGGSGGHGHTHGKSEGHAHSSEMAQVSGGGDHSDHGHTHGEHDHSGHEHSHGDDHGHDHSHGGHDHGAEESHEKEHENVNIRGAFLHVLGDCLQSVGVIIAAGIIWGFNESRYGTNNYAHSWYNLADPFCSILFGIITLYTTMSLFRELFGVLMEGTPLGMNYNEILWALQQIDGVDGVHELHIWSLTTTAAALSVHLRAAAHTAVLEKAESVCRTFGIEHSTIQVDPVGNDGQFLACGNLASCPPNGQTQTSATTAVSII